MTPQSMTPPYPILRLEFLSPWERDKFQRCYQLSSECVFFVSTYCFPAFLRGQPDPRHATHASAALSKPEHPRRITFPIYEIFGKASSPPLIPTWNFRKIPFLPCKADILESLGRFHHQDVISLRKISNFHIHRTRIHLLAFQNFTAKIRYIKHLGACRELHH